MRTEYDGQLRDLHRDLISMGAMCESAIAMSARALDEADVSAAKRVMEQTAAIDRAQRDIEARCIRLLLRQQPVATDLRVISAALKLVTDLERIGDNSGDIAELVALGNITAASDKLNIHDMALATIKMVTDSIDAFVKSNAPLARSVIACDDVVDGHFNRIKTALLKDLRAGLGGDYALDLLMAAKYFERMADHAVNIAKWVLYSITGRMEDGE